ncbi:MAG: DUF3598 family protein [Spirosomaceae bacterium]|jgi:hypothetical protein|nr:DUF3598 family protein [Spirosomataceae bacterium]
MSLRLFPKHLGVWEGTYTRIAPDGSMIDRWKSRLTIRMEGERAYHQVNEYMWDDGHYECHDFGVSMFDDNWELQFDNPRIKGHAWETQNSVNLIWEYKDRPGSMLYEMIDLIGEKEDVRIRTWKWSYHDQFEGLTMIHEHKVSNDPNRDPKFWEELPSKRFTGVSRSNR